MIDVPSASTSSLPSRYVSDVLQSVSQFANNVPVHFRAPALLGLVWLLWGVNVLVFRRYKIDYYELLGFNRSTALSAKKILKSAGLYMFFLFVGFALIWEMPLSDVLIWPSIFYMVGLLLLLLPMDVLHRPGRERLLFNFYRVCIPSAKGVRFVEVLLGDVMTSLCKVFADMEVTFCVILAHMAAKPHSIVGDPSRDIAVAKDLSLYGCSDSWVRPLVTSVPFLLRFHQCIRAYIATREQKNLLNSAKYISSLPVIWISAFTHHYPDHEFTETLKAIWVLAVSFNSFFSFMWDIVMDWGFCRSGASNFLLREHLVYRHAVFYYWGIVVDFFLRVLWSFKLGVHLQLSAEGHTFVLEVLEVFRRHLWIFFRVEWEAIDSGRIPTHVFSYSDLQTGEAIIFEGARDDVLPQNGQVLKARRSEVSMAAPGGSSQLVGRRDEEVGCMVPDSASWTTGSGSSAKMRIRLPSKNHEVVK